MWRHSGAKTISETPDTDLKEAVRLKIRQAGHPVPQGPIRLLTHIRYFGYAFNPSLFITATMKTKS